MASSAPREDPIETTACTLHSSQSQQAVPAKVSSLPETLTLRGPRVVLKTPTPGDDIYQRKIFSDPITVQWLPQFHRSNGWSADEIRLRREKHIAAQSEGKAMTLFIHVRNGEKEEAPPPRPRGDQEVPLTLAGSTGFTTIDLEVGRCEIGIILHHPYWKRGIATEAMYLCLQYAFETLGVQVVQWITSEDNKGMRRWCEALDLKCYPMMTEEMGNSLRFELLQAEWDGRVSGILKGKLLSRTS